MTRCGRGSGVGLVPGLACLGHLSLTTCHCFWAAHKAEAERRTDCALPRTQLCSDTVRSAGVYEVKQAMLSPALLAAPCLRIPIRTTPPPAGQCSAIRSRHYYTYYSLWSAATMRSRSLVHVVADRRWVWPRAVAGRCRAADPGSGETNHGYAQFTCFSRVDDPSDLPLRIRHEASGGNGTYCWKATICCTTVRHQMHRPHTRPLAAGSTN